MIRGPSRPLSPLSTQSSPGRVLGAKQCSFTARSRTKSRGAARRGRRAWWYATAQGPDPRRRADVERWTGHRAGARTSLPHARPPVITASLVLRRRINYRRWWKGAALFRVSGHPRASWRGLVEKGSVGEQRWIGQSRDERKEEEDATVERIPRVFSGLKPERP